MKIFQEFNGKNFDGTTKQIKAKKEAFAAKLATQTSLYDLTLLASICATAKKLHADYEKTEPTIASTNRKAAVRAIMDKIMGFNAALRTLKGFVKDGTIILVNCVDDKEAWNEKQATFALSSVAKVKLFMTAKVAGQKSFSPNDILKAVLTAGQMSATAYANRRQADNHNAEKATAVKKETGKPSPAAKA